MIGDITGNIPKYQKYGNPFIHFGIPPVLRFSFFYGRLISRGPYETSYIFNFIYDPQCNCNGCCRFFYDRIYVFFSSPAPPNLVESIKDNVTALSKIAALREVRAHESNF